MLNPLDRPAVVLSWHGCPQLLQSLCQDDWKKRLTYSFQEIPDGTSHYTQSCGWVFSPGELIGECWYSAKAILGEWYSEGTHHLDWSAYVELCFRHIIGASTSNYRCDHPPDIWCAYLSSGAANSLAYAVQIVCGRGVLWNWWVWPGISAGHPEIQEIQCGDG